MTYSSPNQSSRRRAFSFVELMFAVVVLGIGFIMIAAVFPVGMQQTKVSLDESTASSGSRGVMARLQQIAQATVQYNVTAPGWYTGVLPDTFIHPGGMPVLGTVYPGKVRTLNDPRPFSETAAEDTAPLGVNATSTNADMRRYNMWQAITNEMISPADARNATAVMFKRDTIGKQRAGSNVLYYAPVSAAQVISINAQVANRSLFDIYDVSNNPSVTPSPLQSQRPIYNLEPRPVAVQIVFDATNQTYVATLFSVTKLDGGDPRGGYPPGPHPVTTQTWDNVLDAAALGAPAEGTFLVISDDRLTGVNTGRFNGRIYRLGNRRVEWTDITAPIPHVSFDLAPGYSFATDAGADGILGSPSTDDVLGIGVGANTTTTVSGLPYTNPANAASTIVDGTGTKGGAVGLILGRGFVDPMVTPVAAGAYTGPAMDVAAYTSFLSVP